MDFLERNLVVLGSFGWDDSRAWATAAIEHARSVVAESAADAGMDLSAFDTTLLGVAIQSTTGAFFHVGDGVGIALSDGEWCGEAISSPENGEFVDQTFFVTRPGWDEHLRLTRIPAHTSLIALMTDGVSPFAMAPRLKGVDPKFFGPVTRFLAEADSELGRRALAETLSDSRIDPISGDDRTLFWAQRAVVRDV